MATFPHDLKNAMSWQHASAPAAQTSTVTGAAIDMLGGEGRVTVIQSAGTHGGSATPTLAGKIQQSDDTVSGNFADITGATFTASTAAGVQVINASRTKRYLRYVGTITGTSPTIPFGVIVGEAKKQF